MSSIAKRYANELLEVVAEIGGRPDVLCAEADFDPARHEDSGRVPIATFAALWRAAVEHTGRGDLPYVVAARKRERRDDVVFHACLTSATLREAIQKAIRYLPLWTDGASWYLTPGDPRSALTFVPRGPAPRVLTEFSVACMVARAREYAGHDWTPALASFTHAAPVDRAAAEAFFRAPVRYGAARTELEIDERVLALELRRASPGVTAYFEAALEAQLALVTGDRPIGARLRDLVSATLGQKSHGFEEFARLLGMSPRTLRRRLAVEATSFQRELDTARREAACRLVTQSGMTFGEISHHLGYSTAEVFHRAFKRWTGKTPHEFRHAA